MLTTQEAKELTTSHLEKHRDNYLKLLTATRSAIDIATKEVGDSVVIRSYSRADKQSGNRINNSEFKDKAKIISKLRQKTKEDSAYVISNMIDIVGVTVVVYYNDQINHFIDAFEKAANNAKLDIEPYENSERTRIHRQNGYHATHLKIKARSPKLSSLRLEMQVKTMLHDAWGTKMHDLVYKPAGQLDPRLRALMESFGDSLQAIEVQSETLRDAIVSRIGMLRQRRLTARVNLMHRLQEQKFTKNRAAGTAFRKCFKEIDRNREHLAKCRDDDDAMLNILRDIKALESAGVDPFVRLKITIYLASLRQDTDLAGVVDDSIDEWLKTSKDNDDDATLVWVRASALYQTNRINEAIDILRENLHRRGENDPASAKLKLNLVNYLIEDNLDKLDDDVRPEVEHLISCLPNPDDGGPNKGAILSTIAAYKIVFGSEDELNVGLSQCNEALKVVGPEGTAYCELYLTYGWQRKLRT